MANVKPINSTPKQPEKPAPTPVKKEDSELTPQEQEAKKASEEAKAEEQRQSKIKQLIKSRKYNLPIK